MQEFKTIWFTYKRNVKHMINLNESLRIFKIVKFYFWDNLSDEKYH